MKKTFKDIMERPNDIAIGDYILGVGQILTEMDASFARKLAQYVSKKYSEPNIFIKCLDDNLIPKRQYPDDSGLDIKCAIEKVDIEPNEFAIIPTGISIAIPPGFEGQIRPRSGLTVKGIVATLGTIDAGYRGEIQVTLRNLTKFPVSIKYGQRIAQLVITPVWIGEPIKVQHLPANTERGSNGFGSTGI